MREWHCRYRVMHPGGSHANIYPIFVKAKTAAEAEAEVRKLKPHASKIWVLRVYTPTHAISF